MEHMSNEGAYHTGDPGDMGVYTLIEVDIWKTYRVQTNCFGFLNDTPEVNSKLYRLVGVREKLQETPVYLMGKSMVSG